jgi:uncharacterized repeat protein (TIGR02543 family)
VSHSSFANNSALYGGVARGSTWTVSETIFANNSASSWGGVAYNGTWTVNGSSFTNNFATTRGGVALNGNWTLMNSIVDATNSSGSDLLFESMSKFTNTTDTSIPSPSLPRGMNLIQGGLAVISMQSASVDLGAGYLLDADPLFVNAADPDGADNLWGTADDGLRLQAGSPAIGEGNLNLLSLDEFDVDGDGLTVEVVPLDLAGFMRVQAGSLDLGAYEYGNSVEPLFTLITAAEVGGRISPEGSQNYSIGAVATLSASPDAGYLFDGWVGDANGVINPISVTLNQNRSITATFSTDLGDTDEDGLSNYAEIVTHGSDPAQSDSSGDGLSDKAVVDAGLDPRVSYLAIAELVLGIEPDWESWTGCWI